MKSLNKRHFGDSESFVYTESSLIKIIFHALVWRISHFSRVSHHGDAELFP